MGTDTGWTFGADPLAFGKKAVWALPEPMCARLSQGGTEVVFGVRVERKASYGHR